VSKHSKIQYSAYGLLVENYIRRNLMINISIYICQQYMNTNTPLPSKRYVSMLHIKWHKIMSVNNRNRYQQNVLTFKYSKTSKHDWNWVKRTLLHPLLWETGVVKASVLRAMGIPKFHLYKPTEVHHFQTADMVSRMYI
jgi:hypothetical protein